MAVYYVWSNLLCDEGGNDPKFPATISWTIRKGPPKYIHLLVWGLGWMKMFILYFKIRSRSKQVCKQVSSSSVVKSESKNELSHEESKNNLLTSHDQAGLTFASYANFFLVFLIFMVTCGIVTIYVVGLGEDGELNNEWHTLFAALYMVCFHFFFQIYRSEVRPQIGFWVSFMLTALSLQLMKLVGVPSMSERQEWGKKNPGFAMITFGLELIAMIFENGLFLFFTVGFTSGIKKVGLECDRDNVDKRINASESSSSTS